MPTRKPEEYSHDEAEKDVKIKILFQRLNEIQEEKQRAREAANPERLNSLETKGMEVLAELKATDNSIDTNENSLDEILDFLARKYMLDANRRKQD
jgi:hypothetical protein